jgi:hypothetical protein
MIDTRILPRAGFSLVALVVLIAAVTTVAAAVTAQPGGRVVVLRGASPSLDAHQGVIDTCVRDAAEVAIEAGASLTILPVGNVPVDLRATPIQTRLSLQDRLTPKRAKAAYAQARALVKARIEDLEDTGPPAGASDTITAASIAAEALHGDGRKLLVICDDLHEVGRGLINVYRQRLTAARSRKLIRKLPPTDLSGVTVTLSAVATDGKGRLSQAREAEIARFWTHYWAPAVHARVAYDAPPHF